MVVFCLKESKTLTVGLPEFCENISYTTNMFKPKTFFCMYSDSTRKPMVQQRGAVTTVSTCKIT